MRELKVNEIEAVSGAAWWSTSNIMNLIHSIIRPSTPPHEPGSWFVPDGSPSGSSYIGQGIGMTVVAGIVAATAIFGAASAGLAGILGTAAVVKTLK
jgi:hypothetical protein